LEIVLKAATNWDRPSVDKPITKMVNVIFNHFPKALLDAFNIKCYFLKLNRLYKTQPHSSISVPNFLFYMDKHKKKYDYYKNKIVFTIEKFKLHLIDFVYTCE